MEASSAKTYEDASVILKTIPVKTLSMKGFSKAQELTPV